jgi:hypothetical protein
MIEVTGPVITRGKFWLLIAAVAIALIVVLALMLSIGAGGY